MFKDEVNPSDPITDTDRVAETVQKVRAQIAEDVKAAVREALQEHEKTATKRLHNIFAWIASQFKT